MSAVAGTLDCFARHPNYFGEFLFHCGISPTRCISVGALLVSESVEVHGSQWHSHPGSSMRLGLSHEIALKCLEHSRLLGRMKGSIFRSSRPSSWLSL